MWGDTGSRPAMGPATDEAMTITEDREPLRVALLGLNYAPETTGIAPYTMGLADGLIQRGHQVRVLTGYPHYPEWSIAAGYRGRSMTETLRGVPVRRLRHHVPNGAGGMGRVRMEASFGARLVTTGWDRPDVIVCVSPALLSTAMVLARARVNLRRPAVGVWVQDLYGRGVVETGALSGRSAGAATRFESAVLRSADGVAVIHDRFRDHLVRELSVPRNRVSVIRNWTHLQPHQLGDRAKARAALGWTDDETVVLHAGNMGAKQGLENVVEAARAAEMAGAHVRFVLLGDGNQRARLEEIGGGIANLQFLRPLPDAAYRDAMAAADVLLVNERPGVGEMAVPSKITSYFTTGNPVLAATDAGSITAQEITTSGGGVVVPAADPRALLAAAIELSTDPDRAARLGAAGRRFAAEDLSHRVAIDRYENWIRELAAARRPMTRPRKETTFQ